MSFPIKSIFKKTDPRKAAIDPLLRFLDAHRDRSRYGLFDGRQIKTSIRAAAAITLVATARLAATRWL